MPMIDSSRLNNSVPFMVKIERKKLIHLVFILKRLLTTCSSVNLEKFSRAETHVKEALILALQESN